MGQIKVHMAFKRGALAQHTWHFVLIFIIPYASCAEWGLPFGEKKFQIWLVQVDTRKQKIWYRRYCPPWPPMANRVVLNLFQRLQFPFNKANCINVSLLQWGNLVYGHPFWCLPSPSGASGVMLTMGGPLLAEILRPLWFIWRPLPSFCKLPFFMATFLIIFFVATFIWRPLHVFSAPYNFFVRRSSLSRGYFIPL